MTFTALRSNRHGPEIAARGQGSSMRTRPRYGSPPPPSPVTAHPTICKVSQVLDLTDGLLLLLLLLLLSSSSFFGTLLQYIVHYWKSQNTGNLDIVNFFNIVNLSLMINSSLDRNGGKWTYCIRRYSELCYAIHYTEVLLYETFFFVSNAPSYFFYPIRAPRLTHTSVLISRIKLRIIFEFRF